jgi:hypothetical protein
MAVHPVSSLTPINRHQVDTLGHAKLSARPLGISGDHRTVNALIQI